MDGYTKFRNLASPYVGQGIATENFSKSKSTLITIVTEIREPHSQAGVKSLQLIKIVRNDDDSASISTSYTTGTTDIGIGKIPSIRNNFKVKLLEYIKTDTRESALLYATGETASGVQIMPNINYSFYIGIDFLDNRVYFSGKHDGFPSYYILVGNTKIYDYQQSENESDLWGDGDDIKIPFTEVSL